jgi:hypothetical protein
VKFQICLCDSAITVEYTLTNGTVIARECNQCPVSVQIDRLWLENDFNVYMDDFNITRILVLVSTVILSIIVCGSGWEGGEGGWGEWWLYVVDYRVIPLPTSDGSGLRSGEIV